MSDLTKASEARAWLDSWIAEESGNHSMLKVSAESNVRRFSHMADHLKLLLKSYRSTGHVPTDLESNIRMIEGEVVAAKARSQSSGKEKHETLKMSHTARSLKKGRITKVRVVQNTARTMTDLALPSFSLLVREPKVPHRKHELARYRDEHGICYEVVSNWPRNLWFVKASCDGFKMSNTLQTRNSVVADQWIEAVRDGRVRIVDSKN